MNRRILLAATLLSLAAATPGHAQCRERLVPLETNAWDKAGEAIDVEGDRLIVGADTGNGEGLADGVAYVFERGAAGWVQTGRLTAPDVGYLQSFGECVGISGDVAAAGSPYRQGPWPFIGGVWVFEWDGADWVRTQELVPSNPSEVSGIGLEVAVDGGRVVVAAPSAAGGGALYVFEEVGGSWVQTAKLRPALGDGSGLGFQVAISGDTIVATSNDERVSVFDFDGSAWRRSALLSSSLAPAYAFGRVLALDGDRLVAGAPIYNTTQGRAVVFERLAGTWYERAVLAPNSLEYDKFGEAVAIHGPRVAVGAPWHSSDGGFHHHGAVYLFQLVDDAWQPSYRFFDEPITDDDRFGTSVGLTGGTLLVGVPRDDTPTTDAGTVLVLELPESLSTSCFCVADAPCANDQYYAGCTNSSGLGGLLAPCGSDSAGADDLRLAVEGLPAGKPALLFAGGAVVELPFGDGKLCTGGSVQRLGVETTSGAGAAAWGPGLAALGGFGSGDQPRFQVWFRDPQGPCGGGFNLSNGLGIRYAP